MKITKTKLKELVKHVVVEESIDAETADSFTALDQSYDELYRYDSINDNGGRKDVSEGSGMISAYKGVTGYNRETMKGFSVEFDDALEKELTAALELNPKYSPKGKASDDDKKYIESLMADIQEVVLALTRLDRKYDYTVESKSNTFKEVVGEDVRITVLKGQYEAMLERARNIIG
jgi:hypothetical protein